MQRCLRSGIKLGTQAVSTVRQLFSSTFVINSDHIIYFQPDLQRTVPVTGQAERQLLQPVLQFFLRTDSCRQASQRPHGNADHCGIRLRESAVGSNRTRAAARLPMHQFIIYERHTNSIFSIGWLFLQYFKSLKWHCFSVCQQTVGY